MANSDTIENMVSVVRGFDTPARMNIERSSFGVIAAALLPLGGGVFVFEGPKEGSDEMTQVGAVLDVQGAVPHIAPERRSHMACGLAHSVRDHWALTISGNLSRGRPIFGSVAF